MVNEINVSQRYGAAAAVKASGTPAAEKPAKEESQQEQAAKASKVDTVNLGTRQEESVTYTNVTSKKLSASDIEALKAQADAATENLRKLVEELILKQNKNYKASEETPIKDLVENAEFSADDIEAAKQAISEDGEYGVKAVSDRLVKFAISVSGGDKTKLSGLISAIDEGFAAARKAWGGELPDICQQTYDETMRKLNEWANDKDS